MSENFTIHCESPDFPLVERELSSAGGWTIHENSESYISASCSDGGIVVKAVWPEVGGRFGSIYAGTINRVKRIPRFDGLGIQSLQDNLKNTKMILSFVPDTFLVLKTDDMR